jgi:hypothetical protein
MAYLGGAMQKEFTELLEEWIDAKKDLDEARANYDGYSFSYFHERQIRREGDARDALNALFKKPK